MDRPAQAERTWDSAHALVCLSWVARCFSCSCRRCMCVRSLLAHHPSSSCSPSKGLGGPVTCSALAPDVDVTCTHKSRCKEP